MIHPKLGIKKGRTHKGQSLTNSSILPTQTIDCRTAIVYHEKYNNTDLKTEEGIDKLESKKPSMDGDLKNYEFRNS